MFFLFLWCRNCGRIKSFPDWSIEQFVQDLYTRSVFASSKATAGLLWFLWPKYWHQDETQKASYFHQK